MSLFVTIEGIEGSGKSTLTHGLASLLQDQNIPLLITREPGGTRIGQTIRSLLLDPVNSELTSNAETFLFFADRAQHVNEMIRPALDQGRVVICDRFCHSTFAYQGYGRGIDLSNLRLLNQIATQGLHPNLVLLLDLEPVFGLQRARRRSTDSSTLDPDNSWSRFEEQALAFHTKVRSGFLKLAHEERERFVILDTTKDRDTIALEAAKAVINALRSIRPVP